MRADDAVTTATQVLAHHQARRSIEQQIRLANFLAPAEKRPVGPDYKEYSNNSLWERIVYGDARAEHVIELNSFFIFEWTPRAPGLFIKSEAWSARDEAFRQVIGFEHGMAVLHPNAKASLVEAGVGSVRLKPVLIEGASQYLMSASSEGNCDQGIPIAMPPVLYNTCIDEIRRRGSFVQNVIGRLRFVPECLERLYGSSVGVPQLFLQVEELRPPSLPKSRAAANLRVAIACVFEGTVDGRDGDYLAYATFNPGIPGDLDRTISWLEHDYVHGRFKGRIVTDFDQQQARFSNAPFSLETVMGLHDPYDARQPVIQRLRIDSAVLNLQRSSIESLRVAHMEHIQVTVSGQGHLVVVKSHLENSAATVNLNLAESKASGEVNKQIKLLMDEVTRLADQIDLPDAKKLGRNLEKLSEEVKEEEPDRDWIQTSLSGIQAAASAIGELGGPILGIVKTLWSLLVGSPCPWG